MNANRKLVTLFAVALAATALSVGSAFAQAIETVRAEGRFMLPFAAQWGTAALPAGSYTLVAGYTKVGQRVIEVRGEAEGSPHAFVFAITHDQGPTANANELLCVRQGNRRMVRALVLTNLGEILRFSIPKNTPIYAQRGSEKPGKQLARGPELIQRVPVEVAGL